jgi:hypothetical protein
VSTQPANRLPSYIAAYIALAVAFVAAIVAVVVFGAIEAFGSSDRYGNVPIPGRATLDLPEGDITVYYQEDVELGENETLDPPTDIRLGVRHEDGGPSLELDRGGISNEVSGGFGTRVSVGDLDVPAAGDYEVAVGPTSEARNDPAIVFGDDLFEGFFDAVPLGLLVLAAGLVVAAILFVLTYARRRRIGESGPTLSAQ